MTSDQVGVTIGVAARRLGISENAVRKRINRGSLEATKDQNGQWRVVAADQATDQAGGSRDDGPASDTGMSPDARIAELEAKLEAIRDERDWLRQRVDRWEHLQAGLIERLPVLPPPPQAPPRDDDPQNTQSPVADDQDAPRDDPPQAEADDETLQGESWRSWWRKFWKW